MAQRNFDIDNMRIGRYADHLHHYSDDDYGRRQEYVSHACGRRQANASQTQLYSRTRRYDSI